MKLKYDNLDDAKTKLVSTFCMYDKKAFYVKFVEEEPEGTYIVSGSFMSNGRSVITDINDPKFNCYNYNIGYLNLMTRAAWFYRIPMKQYRQGLRFDQVRMKYSSNKFSEIPFQSSKAMACMLENSYPDFQSSTELLRAGEANIVAFHKDFAATYDSIHKDYILEYKGTKIGFTHNPNDWKLMDEFRHLTESLKEAVG